MREQLSLLPNMRFKISYQEENFVGRKSKRFTISIKYQHDAFMKLCVYSFYDAAYAISVHAIYTGTLPLLSRQTAKFAVITLFRHYISSATWWTPRSH